MNRDSKLFKFKDRTIAILLRTIKTNKWAILSGVFIGTSYIPFPPWAILFGLVPLWIDILENRESFVQSFIRGWWTQAVLTAIGFYWIAYVSHEYGFMPWPVALLVLLVFVATVHIYFAVACGVTQYLRNRLHLSTAMTAALLATLTALGEIYWPSLFPWNFGYTFLWIKSPIAQTADVFGFQGLSVLVLFANAALAWALHRAKTTGQYRFLIAKSLAVIVIFAGLHFWGLAKQSRWQETDSKMRILQVQANVGNFEKVMAERGGGYEQLAINEHFRLTREGLQKNPGIDLVIWPETAYPDYLNAEDLQRRPNASQLVSFLREANTPIMTGGFSHIRNAKGIWQNYNALFLLDPESHIFGEPYHKTDLLIFGEYTPLTDYFPSLAQISPAGEGWRRGNGPQILPFHDIKLGPQICYESLYPEFSAASSLMGADILINLTNDSWFGPTAESYQHMIMTLARGVETRRPLVRATNTGITTAILADGTQLEESPRFTPWYGVYEVSFKKHAPITFYTKYQSWLPVLLLIFVFLVLLNGMMKAKKHERH